MKLMTLVTLGLSAVAFSADDLKVSDWRVELLEQEGIGISVEKLQEALIAVPEVTIEFNDSVESI